MNKDMQALIIGLIAKVGLAAAIDIIEGLTKVTTIDDALVALKASAAKDWAAYKLEA